MSTPTTAMRQWRKSHPEEYRSSNRIVALKYRYGLTVEQYDAMLLAQGGGCALCGSTMKKYRLSVDHNHGTGAVRGILCQPCNSALARIEDEAWMLKAVAYLSCQSP